MNKIVRKNIPFTQVPNVILCDNKISLKAKGLYVYLFSKPADWVFFREIIEKETKESYDAFRAGINELVTAGYIKKHQQNQKGKFSGTIFEFVPLWENPTTENPLTENRPTTNTDYISSSYEDKINNIYINNTPYNPPRDESIVGTSSGDLCATLNPQERLQTEPNNKNLSLGSANTSEHKASDGALTNLEFVDSKFEEMWACYKPYVTYDGHSVNKGAKKTAKEKFVKAVTKGADPDQIILGTKNYIADCHVHKCLTKNVVTFLNQEQWRDYLDEQPKPQSKTKQRIF